MTSGEMATMGATNQLPLTVGGVNTGALYDAQGNLTQIYGTPGLSTTQLTMTYDSLGRAITLGDTANATSQTYGYDDEGLRIKVTDSKTGLVKYNLYDEARHLIAQAEVLPGGSYTWKKDLIYVGDKEVAEVDATGKTWVQFEDHLGSPRFEWDGTATTTIDGVHLVAQKYAPFGEYLNDPTTLAKFAKGFTNHEQTDPSGLIYMQARFYAPMYGRFLSPDPARDQHFEQTQSWNIYSYVQNSPTMRIDPTGMIGGGADDRVKNDDKTKTEEEAEKAKAAQQNADKAQTKDSKKEKKEDAGAKAGDAIGKTDDALTATAAAAKAAKGSVHDASAAAKLAKLGEGAEAAEHGTLIVGIGISAVQTARGKQSKTKLAVDVGVGLAGAEMGGIEGAAVGLGYGLMDHFYPGGWGGFKNDLKNAMDSQIEHEDIMEQGMPDAMGE